MSHENKEEREIQENANIILVNNKLCLYEEIPTLVEYHCDPIKDAKFLRNAMEDSVLIQILCSRTNAQRLHIADAYAKEFQGRNLINDIKSETRYKFKEVLLALMTPSSEYFAKCLKAAMTGLGTKNKILIDIVCTSTSQELKAIQSTYYNLYKRRLCQDISSDTSGYYQATLVSLCNIERCNDTTVDLSLVSQDADELFRGGINKLGTDENVFINILTTRSYAHLREVFKAYQKITKEDIGKSIDSEFSGCCKDALKAIVNSTRHRSSYFAQRLRDAMHGLGTNDDTLISTIVGRSEIDLETIKQVYQRSYSKTLAGHVKLETSGSYQKALLKIIGN